MSDLAQQWTVILINFCIPYTADHFSGTAASSILKEEGGGSPAMSLLTFQTTWHHI